MHFIGKHCEVCGGEDCGGAALSVLRLTFGYGSENDGERVELALCGDCADRLYRFVQTESGVIDD